MTASTNRTLRLALGFSASLATLALGRAALAADLPPFGQPGHVVFDDLVGFRFGEPGYLGQLRSAGFGWFGTAPPPTVGQGGIFGYEHGSDVRPMMLDATTSANVHVTTDTIWIAPAFDYFIARRVSLGASLGLLYSNIGVSGPSVFKGEKADALLLSIVPRVGYVVPITDRLALWPRLAVGYTTAASGQYFGQIGGWGAPQSVQTWIAGGDLGVVFRVTRNLMLHLTPSIVASYTKANEAQGAFHDFAIGAAGEASVAATL
jgi:hypothetical protein